MGLFSDMQRAKTNKLLEEQLTVMTGKSTRERRDEEFRTSRSGQRVIRQAIARYERRSAAQ